MKKKGIFITFEGGEGSGKSSLMERIGLELTEKYPVLTTREPGGTPLGEKIRHLLLSHHQDELLKIAPLTELLLFLAARAQHLDEVIRPALAAGTIVLCDRFNDSTIAYQGTARGGDQTEVESLCHLVTGSTKPDLTFLLDIDPAVGLARAKRINKIEAGAGVADRIESETIEFHKKVRKAFLELSKKDSQRFIILDATQPLDEVYRQASAKLNAFLLG